MKEPGGKGCEGYLKTARTLRPIYKMRGMTEIVIMYDALEQAALDGDERKCHEFTQLIVGQQKKILKDIPANILNAAGMKAAFMLGVKGGNKLLAFLEARRKKVRVP